MSQRRDRLLAVLVVIAVVAALKLTVSVTLPLAFALFLVALTWPIHRFAARWLPRGVAAVIALLVFLGVVTGIGAMLAESADEMAEKWPQYSERWHAVTEDARSFAEARGVELSKPDLQGHAVRISRSAFGFFGGAVLVCAFMVLGLLEVSDYAHKLRRGSQDPERWKRVADRVARDFQRYVLVRTAVGAITGGLVTLACWIIGLDLAFIWGLVNFLLNYIPTLGSILGIVPPVLFALVQGESLGLAAVTLVVIGGIQLVMGNWIDPLIQGRYLKLSPLVVLLSVVFWGFVWGIPGAFIGMPLTIVIVLVCREFESTRWISVMLAEAEDGDQIADQPLRGEPDGQKVPS